jgi:hypothetical protein
MATAKGTALDTFANIAAVKVTMSGTDTLTTGKFSFPFSIMDKMGLVISRIEYMANALTQLNTSGDYALLGLCVAASLVDALNQADPNIIDYREIVRYDYGTAASALLDQEPYVKDFSMLPGGGLLVAPNPLYAFMTSSGAGAAMNGWVKLYYTYKELGTDEYWQLVESRRIITS